MQTTKFKLIGLQRRISLINIYQFHWITGPITCKKIVSTEVTLTLRSTSKFHKITSCQWMSMSVALLSITVLQILSGISTFSKKFVYLT